MSIRVNILVMHTQTTSLISYSLRLRYQSDDKCAILADGIIEAIKHQKILKRAQVFRESFKYRFKQSDSEICQV